PDRVRPGLGEPEVAVRPGGNAVTVLSGVGIGNSVTTPPGVIRPIALAKVSTNQTLPSAPRVATYGAASGVGSGYSWITGAPWADGGLETTQPRPNAGTSARRAARRMNVSLSGRGRCIFPSGEGRKEVGVRPNLCRREGATGSCGAPRARDRTACRASCE